MKNLTKPEIVSGNEGYFYTVADGSRLFIYDYQSVKDYHTAIFIIAGITGINHNTEKDIIDILSNNENRVVIIHPRGTGYSEGKLGDIKTIDVFINDFIEIISNDKDYNSKQHKMFLYGHSMSTAVLLAVADKLENINGAILVNPPLKQKKAKGLSPGFWQYVKYAWYYVFAKHKPVVNMAGDPSQIENEEDRKDSENNSTDTLLVKYFSMHYMDEVRKSIQSMPGLCKKADYPLLLIYGMNDNIVDKKGCDLIFENWKHPAKEYVLIENGSHGKSTVKLAKEIIAKWIKDHQA
ncbi:MAG: lysophospholipase [Chitinophagaceae bacterium]|nr:lysophospholipase [Chitinophagaceae bacterium]